MLGLAPALAVHDSIVGVALEWAAREVPGHPAVERVVHEQVRQDRRDGRPLRSSLAALLKGAVWVLERGSEPPLDIQQHPAGVGDRPHRPDHEIPRHLIEELLDIKIDHPVVLEAPLPAHRERIMSRSARPIAIGVRDKPMVRPFLQMHRYHRLRDPVRDRRHTQHSDPAAVRLGDLHRPDRRREVGPRAHPIPDLVEIAPQIGLELLKIHLVHSRRSLVGLDPPPRLPDHPPGNRKRFPISRPLRSTPTPASRGFAATTGRSASERRNRYSMPPVSAVGTLPLATLGGLRPRVDAFDARLLTFRARAADQAHAAFTPGTTWPVIGTPARLITEEQPDPPLSMPPRFS